MTEQTTPPEVRRYVESLLDCGMQLATILDHMYRFENPDPDVPPPPEVLRKLLTDTLAPHLAARTTDLKRARRVLDTTAKAIEDEIFLVDPDYLTGPVEPGRLH
jgi:hypothetical protein